jgi:hypothetical protein
LISRSNSASGRCPFQLRWIALGLACLVGQACATHPASVRGGGTSIAVAPPRRVHAGPYGKPLLAPGAEKACRELAAQAHAMMAHVKDKGISGYVEALADLCIPTASGAWTTSTAPSRAPESDNGNASLRVALLHIDRGGAITAATPFPTLKSGEAEGDNCCTVYGGTDIVVRPVADYDGDGEAELYVGAIQEGNEGHHTRQNTTLAATPIPVVMATTMSHATSRRQRLR